MHSHTNIDRSSFRHLLELLLFFFLNVHLLLPLCQFYIYICIFICLLLKKRHVWWWSFNSHTYFIYVRLYMKKIIMNKITCVCVCVCVVIIFQMFNIIFIRNEKKKEKLIDWFMIACKKITFYISFSLYIYYYCYIQRACLFFIFFIYQFIFN